MSRLSSRPWVADGDNSDGEVYPDAGRAAMGCIGASLNGTEDTERTTMMIPSRHLVVARQHGLVTHFKTPGDIKVQLYQPRYTKRRGG